MIDHDVELTSLFKNLDAIICMPYTSVGFHFAKLEEKSSLFFDNTSKIKNISYQITYIWLIIKMN